MAEQLFVVIETIKSPLFGVDEQTTWAEMLTTTELSMRYPRGERPARIGATGLMLAYGELQTGIEDWEVHQTLLTRADDELLSIDPRIVDTEFVPDELPQDYVMSEGYEAWLARKTPYGIEYPYAVRTNGTDLPKGTHT